MSEAPKESRRRTRRIWIDTKERHDNGDPLTMTRDFYRRTSKSLLSKGRTVFYTPYHQGNRCRSETISTFTYREEDSGRRPQTDYSD